MKLHSKSFLIYFIYCLVPLLLLAGINYWNGLRSVDSTLSSQAQTHLNALSGELDRRLQNEQVELARAALSPQLQLLITSRKPLSESGSVFQQTEATPTLPPELFNSLSSILKGSGHLDRIAVYDQNRLPVFQLERAKNSQNVDTFNYRSVNTSIQPPATPLVGKDSSASLDGSTIRFFAPITDTAANQQIGTVVGELSLEEVVRDTSAVLNASGRNPQTSFVTVIDQQARIVFNLNRESEGKLVSSELPEFLPIAESLARNTPGVTRFSMGGRDFITAYSPLPQWDLGLAVGLDRSSNIGSAHKIGIVGTIWALLAAGVGALLLSTKGQKKSEGIERVEEGLTAIRKGELDKKIELRSSDDVRVIADSINAITEQMRAQIAREEESRQFQAFARLSAMLTHDLKNSIEALSLIVGNMEQHFDNAEFRADAMRSLTSATDKLRGLVTRLTKPLTSLSGEHPRPKSVDLIPILKRVAAKTAEPMRDKHEIKIDLPKHLFAYVDPERIENVIENLIINALEAMADRKGKLTIAAGVNSRGAAMFSVSDTGPGMSQSFISSSLYKPFSTTKRNGVGLGLYTCREVVEASAGKMEVESVEGAGTTFRVVLPSASHDSRS